jgi:hypothetical protein
MEISEINNFGNLTPWNVMKNVVMKIYILQVNDLARKNIFLFKQRGV